MNTIETRYQAWLAQPGLPNCAALPGTPKPSTTASTAIWPSAPAVCGASSAPVPTA